MKTLRCIIVDDEPLAVKMLEGFVARTPFLELAGSYNDPVLALSEIRSLAPELVFLDIQMPDLDGMELSRMLPPDTRVVFTTAFKQYAFESYEVKALDFLLKPIRSKRRHPPHRWHRPKKPAFSSRWTACSARWKWPISNTLRG